MKLIKNLDKLFEVKNKLGSIVTKDCLKYFTKCNFKQLYEEGLIKKKNYNIIDSSNKILVENIPCVEFTDKFNNLMKKHTSYSHSYQSPSQMHDVALSHNVYKYAKDNGVGISNYISESELPVTTGLSRPDGAFIIGDRIVAIEQTTINYTKEMIEEKEAYCSYHNMDIEFY